MGGRSLGELGDKPADAVSLFDIESFREHRKAHNLSAVAINHDLRLLRKIFNWGIRKGLVARTPFKIGTEPAIHLEREVPRHVRLTEEQESPVLEAANSHLRAVIIAILETACRPGEILALQWKNVSLERRELILTAAKTKTRSERLVPISRRLHAVLEMRQTAADGKRLPPEAYVFGNDIGERVKSVRTAWENARITAGLGDVHLADLRHEAASRFDEAGVPVNFVSKILGHTNLTTTSRYLNIHRRGLHLAMQKFEESRRLASLLQRERTEPAEALSDESTPPEEKPLVS